MQTVKAWVHLAVLWALAIAQPLFSVLADQPEFFVARGNTSGDIIVLAIALVLVPPTVLVAVELLLTPLAAVRRAVHLAFVAVLVAAFVLQALEELIGGGSSAILLPLAVAGGVAGAAAYAATRFVGTVLTALAPVPLLFAALFLLVSPVSKLVLPQEAEARNGAQVTSSTPVVLVVFDELPSFSLEDGRKRIDGTRFPNFAALARSATWYRNATTVADLTPRAVPAILTGRVPEADQLPILSDHPRNLFTVLEDRYEFNVEEPVTDLCPPIACPDEPREDAGERLRALVDDLSIVSLHRLLPSDLDDDLPPVDRTFAGFGDDAGDPAADGALKRMGQLGLENRPGRAYRVVSNIRPPGERPTLNVLHVELPHTPYQYLPSGEQYAQSSKVPEPGAGDDAAALAYRRYLLQLGYTDRLLGDLLRRLRRTGLYDEALVVVAADHGVSHRPGHPARFVRAGNFPDVAGVPLFVKLPGQTTGRVDTGAARTVDVLPTIARELGIGLDWQLDGRPLGRNRHASSVTVVSEDGPPVTQRWRDFVRARDRRAAVMARRFGAGDGWAGLYRGETHGDLVGTQLAELRPVLPASASAQIDNSDAFEAVGPSRGAVPALLTGRLHGSADGRPEVAIALNGRVEAVTGTYRDGDDVRLAAILPSDAFRQGANRVEVLEIRRGARGRQFAMLRMFAFRLSERDGHVELVAGGRRLPVVPGAVAGAVEVVEPRWRAVAGWAADLQRGRPADEVILFDGARFLASERPRHARPDVVLARGDPRLRWSGFAFGIEGDARPDFARLRVFAIARGRASELPRRPRR